MILNRADIGSAALHHPPEERSVGHAFDDCNLRALAKLFSFGHSPSAVISHFGTRFHVGNSRRRSSARLPCPELAEGLE